VADALAAPYRPDEAALHHLFPGGWIWVLRFDSGLISAGVAAEASLARDLRLEEGEPAWRRLLSRLPAVERHLGPARPTTPFFHRPIPYRAARAAGEGWTLLPSAVASIDPLLSTGFPLTLLGIERLGHTLERDFGTPRLGAALEHGAALAVKEAEAAAALVGVLYRAFDDPPLFRALSLLYFAAASYAESARRLGRPELAHGFLLCEEPRFAPAFERLTRRAAVRPLSPEARATLLDELADAILPFDVAGLSFPGRTRFPHRIEDVVEGAPKLFSTESDVGAAVAAGAFG
jgi:FADH2 O2-dependent halogenase